MLLVVLNVMCYDELLKCFKGMFFYIFGSIGKFKGIKWDEDLMWLDFYLIFKGLFEVLM